MKLEKMDDKFMDLIREEIDSAIAYAKQVGYTIKPGMWVGTRDKCCCPLGACIVEAYGIDNRSAATTAELSLPGLLSISKEEMYSFADGFDGQYYKPNLHSRTFFELGKEYRKKYVDV